MCPTFFFFLDVSPRSKSVRLTITVSVNISNCLNRVYITVPNSFLLGFWRELQCRQASASLLKACLKLFGILTSLNLVLEIKHLIVINFVPNHVFK